MHNIRFQSPLMKRSTSLTIVKHESDSDDDDEEVSFEESEPTCINGISLRKGVIICSLATVIQSIINFFIFLNGCGIEKYHLIAGTLPLIISILTSSLFAYSTVHKSSFSIRPFIAYHLAILCCIGFFFILFITFVLLPRLPLIFNSFIQDSLSPFHSFQSYVNRLSITGRIFYSLFLLSMITLNLISLHISTSFYVFLESCLRYLKNDDTTNIY